MSAQPPSPTIVCPACPPEGGPQLLSIAVEDQETRCPACGRRFRLVTRRIANSRSMRLAAQRTRYQVTTEEGRGQTRLRVIDAQPNVRLRSGSWVTLVYRGPRLVGIADQTAVFWYPVPVVPPRSRQVARLLTILGAVCLFAAALQAARFTAALGGFVADHSFAGVAALLVVGLLVASPALLWALQTARVGEAPEDSLFGYWEPE